jgi:hypothetical protein
MAALSKTATSIDRITISASLIIFLPDHYSIFPIGTNAASMYRPRVGMGTEAGVDGEGAA